MWLEDLEHPQICVMPTSVLFEKSSMHTFEAISGSSVVRQK